MGCILGRRTGAVCDFGRRILDISNLDGNDPNSLSQRPEVGWVETLHHRLLAGAAIRHAPNTEQQYPLFGRLIELAMPLSAQRSPRRHPHRCRGTGPCFPTWCVRGEVERSADSRTAVFQRCLCPAQRVGALCLRLAPGRRYPVMHHALILARRHAWQISLSARKHELIRLESRHGNPGREGLPCRFSQFELHRPRVFRCMITALETIRLPSVTPRTRRFHVTDPSCCQTKNVGRQTDNSM